MSVAFNKFNAFVDALANKKINLATDTLNWMLTNVAPVATNSVYANLTDLSTAGGYTAGGAAMASNSLDTATAGTDKLKGNATVFTATTGFGPFRYAALYSNTATNKDLIGWYDYGSAVTLAALETFTIASAVGGNFDATNPVLSIT